MKKTTKGQMRVVETILASLVILFAMTFVNMFFVAPQSLTYEMSELEKVGYNVLHTLDEKGILNQFVCTSQWDKLTAALMVSFPTNVYFNLTVYDLEGNIVNNAPIRYGNPEVFETSGFVASVKYIVSGYETYNPRKLILQLVEG